MAPLLSVLLQSIKHIIFVFSSSDCVGTSSQSPSGRKLSSLLLQLREMDCTRWYISHACCPAQSKRHYKLALRLIKQKQAIALTNWGTKGSEKYWVRNLRDPQLMLEMLSQFTNVFDFHFSSGNYAITFPAPAQDCLSTPEPFLCWTSKEESWHVMLWAILCKIQDVIIFLDATYVAPSPQRMCQRHFSSLCFTESQSSSVFTTEHSFLSISLLQTTNLPPAWPMYSFWRCFLCLSQASMFLWEHLPTGSLQTTKMQNNPMDWEIDPRPFTAQIQWATSPTPEHFWGKSAALSLWDLSTHTRAS